MSFSVDNSKSREVATQPLRHITSDYQLQTRRPLVCLVFVLPFLFFYEIGVILLGTNSIRSGLDVWLSNILGYVGASELLLLPLLTIFVLFGKHHFQRDSWSIRPRVLIGMLFESLGLALIIWFAAKAQHLFLLQFSDQPTLKMFINSQATDSSKLFGWPQLVSFCGAGLYEELAFRLLLLPGLIWALIRCRLNPYWATGLAVVLSSLFFAATHCEFLNPAALPFEWPSFMARVVVSIFFCAVFLFRGFGVVVGAHVFYDVIAQCW